MVLNNKSTVWEFVGLHYPGYYQSDDIAHNDDLCKLLEGEVNGAAEELLHTEYDGDINNPRIQQDYNESQAYILEESIKAYLESL